MNHPLMHRNLALLCTACLGTTVALAADPIAQSVKLRYRADDLDKQHVAQLYARIETAARVVCAPRDSRELWRHRMFQICVNDAIDRAVQQIHSADLTAIHLADHEHALAPRL